MQARSRRLVACVASVVAAALPPAAPAVAESNGGTRVMPLGDTWLGNTNPRTLLVFVATIIPMANEPQESLGRAYNATIPGMVQSKVNAGKRVHLVDMHSAVTTADLIDGVHPNATGYDKMAATWYNALRSVPPASNWWSTARRAWTPTARVSANGTQLVLWSCSGQSNQQWRFRPRPGGGGVDPMVLR